jgi:hypothetical protein
MSHTPGPWEVAYLDQNEQSVVKAKYHEICTCWHHCVSSIEKEMHDNARLIAAAPDLLKALQDLFGADMEHVLRGDGKPDQLEAISKARDAIAKATGAA